MPASPPRAPLSERREIELDFLRGIAILLVVDYHSPRPLLAHLFGPKDPGWAGVDIFFVLSGFLVGGLLVKEWALRGRPNALRFLIRRAFKIWPQYYVFLLYLLLRHHATLYDLRGNLLNIQNYVGPFTQTWSLAVEEHAYLFLVLFFAIASRLRANTRQLFLCLAALSAIVVVLKLVLTAQRFPTFAATHTRIDGIFYGVMLAILYHTAPGRFGRLQSHRWLWLLIAAAALLYFRFPPPTLLSIPTHWIFADATGVALLLLLYRHREDRTPSLPYRLVARIGLYSYGIFLWHMSVYPAVDSIAQRLPAWSIPAWQSIGPYIFGILAGIAATICIEFPALRLREKLFPRPIDSPVGIPAIIEEESLTRP
jgi:peptidoglycan/LPS O-acetylase OafA/YrhL